MKGDDLTQDMDAGQGSGGDAARDNAVKTADDATAATATSARVPLIAGNWKMNLDHLQAIALVQKLSWALDDYSHDFAKCEVAVFPPFTALRSVQTLIVADRLRLALGAQDVSEHAAGAYTGEVSASMLSALGVSYVLLGHSERRSLHGESDASISRKACAALKAGLTPIVCVGETAAQREAGDSQKVVAEQLGAAIAGIPAGADIVVAYEPVWAIGSGEPLEPQLAGEAAAGLREQVAVLCGAEQAERVRVLYGGSVTSANIASLMRESHVDGVLVGGASIKSDEFTSIARFQKHVAF